MAAIIQICNTENGTYTDLPDPQTMTVGIQDVDSSKTGRNQKGKMFRDRVAIKEKLTCTWGATYSAEAYQILNAVKNSAFWIKYYSPRTNSVRKVQVYVGDRSLQAYNLYDPTDTSKILYSSISMNFIEY